MRAAHALMILKLMGYDKAKNFDGSFGEWSQQADTLIEK
jgi:3-mercaptopyruvate sulfurtransferase SseA